MELGEEIQSEKPVQHVTQAIFATTSRIHPHQLTVRWEFSVQLVNIALLVQSTARIVLSLHSARLWEERMYQVAGRALQVHTSIWKAKLRATLVVHLRYLTPVKRPVLVSGTTVSFSNRLESAPVSLCIHIMMMQTTKLAKKMAQGIVSTQDARQQLHLPELVQKPY
jgi:hypothetical protein